MDRRPEPVGRYASPIALLVALGVWEAGCRVFAVPRFLLPAPSAIAVETWAFGANWWGHVGATLLTVFSGLGLALAIAVPLGVVIARSPLAHRVVYPFLVINQATPVIAIAPIVVVLAGTGLLAKAIVAATVSVFPIVVSIATGLMATPREYLELARSIDDTPSKALVQIRVPFAVRHIFSGLRVGVTLALIGAVVAEFVSAGEGVGYIVYSSTSYMKTPLAFGGLLILAAMGLGLFAAVGLIQSTFFSWSRDMPGGDGTDA